jgi:hypothetical protein
VNLLNIPGIGKTSLQLLEAAGFTDIEALAQSTAPELARTLERANAILKISKRSPSQTTLKKWITSARAHLNLPGPSEAASSLPVNYEQSPQVAVMLSNAPFAIPLPAKTLVENQLGVQNIPAAILLNCYTGDLDVRVEQRLPASRQIKPAAIPNSYVKVGDFGNPRIEIDTFKIRTTASMVDPMLNTEPVPHPSEPARVTLIRSPRASTNEGRSPQSRWYIRGVLHSHPLSIVFGAITTLCLMIITPASVISTALLLLSVESPTYFAWVPKGLLIFPAALPVFGLVYLMLALSGTCRVCGQKLFTHRPHLKNSKAHHVPGLGHILPLCVQILLFRWFRCTHCGTPIRLKE